MSELLNSQWSYPDVLNRVGFAVNEAKNRKKDFSLIRILADRYWGGSGGERLERGALSCPPIVSVSDGIEGFALFDGELRLVDADEQLCATFGKTRTEMMGCSFDEFFTPEGVAVRAPLDGGNDADLVWSNVSLPGAIESRGGRHLLSIWHRNFQNELAFVCVCVGKLPGTDTSAGHSSHTLDQLAGLLSPHEIALELNHAVRPHSAGRSFVLMLLSLDSIPAFTSLFGHVSGQWIVNEVIDRLHENVGDHGLVGQLRADEFAIILDSEDPLPYLELAHQIVASTCQPYFADKEEVTINVKAGLSRFPEHGLNAEQIGRAAHTALTHAKRLNRGVQVFHEQLGKSRDRRVELERSLRQALERDEFELEYQPRIDLRSMRVVAMEALIRWNHPQLGRIPPLDFIPIAEEIGLIGAIGRWALHSACAFASELARNSQPVRVSVNVSAQQLTDVEIAKDTEWALSQTGLHPELLELELTESLLIEDRQRCAELLQRLKNIGISLSVDDFGTGYSSLAYLQLFPVNAIKLDKTFVNRGGEGRNNLRLVKALIDLAHALDLQVVAEGVESAEVLRFLHACGCDEIQGYLVARPLKAVELRRFLSAYIPSLEHVARSQPESSVPLLAAAA